MKRAVSGSSRLSEVDTDNGLLRHARFDPFTTDKGVLINSLSTSLISRLQYEQLISSQTTTWAH